MLLFEEGMSNGHEIFVSENFELDDMIFFV